MKSTRGRDRSLSLGQAPGRRGRRLRPLGVPTTVEVHTDGRGKPALVLLSGKRLPVVSVRSMWRIDDEWWRRPISRWYFELVLDDGRLLTVYRDLEEGAWFVQPGT